MSETLLLLALPKTTNFTHGEPGYPRPTTLQKKLFVLSKYVIALQVFLSLELLMRGEEGVSLVSGICSRYSPLGLSLHSFFVTFCPSLAKTNTIANAYVNKKNKFSPLGLSLHSFCLPP